LKRLDFSSFSSLGPQEVDDDLEYSYSSFAQIKEPSSHEVPSSSSASSSSSSSRSSSANRRGESNQGTGKRERSGRAAGSVIHTELDAAVFVGDDDDMTSSSFEQERANDDDGDGDSSIAEDGSLIGNADGSKAGHLSARSHSFNDFNDTATIGDSSIANSSIHTMFSRSGPVSFYNSPGGLDHVDVNKSIVSLSSTTGGVGGRRGTTGQVAESPSGIAYKAGAVMTAEEKGHHLMKSLTSRDGHSSSSSTKKDAQQSQQQRGETLAQSKSEKIQPKKSYTLPQQQPTKQKVIEKREQQRHVEKEKFEKEEEEHQLQQHHQPRQMTPLQIEQLQSLKASQSSEKLSKYQKLKNLRSAKKLKQQQQQQQQLQPLGQQLSVPSVLITQESLELLKPDGKGDNSYIISSTGTAAAVLLSYREGITDRVLIHHDTQYENDQNREYTTSSPLLSETSNDDLLSIFQTASKDAYDVKEEDENIRTSINHSATVGQLSSIEELNLTSLTVVTTIVEQKLRSSGSSSSNSKENSGNLENHQQSLSSSTSLVRPSTAASIHSPMNFIKGEVIGEGTFGKVYKGLNEKTGELLAIKQFFLADGTKQEVDELQKEIDVMWELNHENIVR
jgi:hypothetical protein